MCLEPCCIMCSLVQNSNTYSRHKINHFVQRYRSMTWMSWSTQRMKCTWHVQQCDQLSWNLCVHNINVRHSHFLTDADAPPTIPSGWMRYLPFRQQMRVPLNIIAFNCGPSENRLHSVELRSELCQSLWPHKRIPETLVQKIILLQRHMLLQQSM